MVAYILLRNRAMASFIDTNRLQAYREDFKESNELKHSLRDFIYNPRSIQQVGSDASLKQTQNFLVYFNHL